MSFFSLVIIGLNIIILFLITDKIRKMLVLQQQFKQIQDNIASLVKENSQIVNVLLEDLENKLKEAKDTVMMLERHTKNPAESEKKPPLDETIKARDYANEPSTPQNTGSKIVYLRQQGLSVQEIAEQLNVPQGEISLKLNLLDKKIKH